MLIIEKNIADNTIDLINISSVNGKPRSLTFKYNIQIYNYNPPLNKLSFAKVNAKYIIDDTLLNARYLFYKGVFLDNEEVNNIIHEYNTYEKDNHNIINIAIFSESELDSINY